MAEKNSDYFSEGGQIYFLDGWAWGIAPNGQPICMGKEEDILEALKDNKSTGNATIDNILTQEMENRGIENMTSTAGMGRTTIQNRRGK